VQSLPAATVCFCPFQTRTKRTRSPDLKKLDEASVLFYRPRGAYTRYLGLLQ
jgi:hypothetical protein